jgi:hypothetical protein
MKTNSYLKPAWTHNGSVRTDLSLMVFQRSERRKVATVVVQGQLCCVGEIYLRMHEGLLRIR